MLGYMLGGCNLFLSVVVFLVGVLDMSGWLLMGLLGVMYLFGLSKVWIVIGLVFGVWVNYFLVVFWLCVYIEKVNDLIIIFDYFVNCFEDNKNILCVIFVVVIIVFFILYILLGVVVGGKLFENLFNMSYEMGLYIIMGVVVFYILFGGFLVVSLIDFV